MIHFQLNTVSIVVGTLLLFLLVPSCDRNNSRPEVTDQVFYIDENSEKGAFVGHLEATDMDDHLPLSFEIVDGNKEGAFYVEKSSGNIFVNHPEALDYERVNKFDLQIVVSDNHPGDPLESAAKISVVLKNLNEYAPFMEDLTLSVKERCLTGTQIGTLLATDADSGQVLSYRIEGGNEDRILQLDSLTGDLMVEDSTWFDYSVHQSLVFMVSVCDNDPEVPLKAYALVTVEVENIPLVTIDVTGFVQKGPYIFGSFITLSELNNDLEPTGRTFSAQISDNTGRFLLPDLELESRFVQLKAEGYYFNERTGNLSEGKLILHSLVDMADSESFNVNVLSHLERERILFLIGEGMDFRKAKEQARNDILDIFSFKSMEQHLSCEMDIARAGEDNAMLLALSVILQGDRTTGEFSELMGRLSQDIRVDGILSDDSIGTGLINGLISANMKEIRQFTEQRYNGLDMAYEIPEFERYVNQFITQTSFVASKQRIFPE